MDVAGSDAFTVAEVLTLPAMEGASIVAGERGLSHPVEAVGVLDVTDPDCLQINQLVLSSVYPLRDIDLERLLPTLSAKGASAIGLKLSGYWPEVPESLVVAANQLGLPLLILPEGPFDDLVNPLLAATAGRQAERLRRSAELHARLTRAALAEHGELAAVADLLAAALRSPSAIFDERGEVVAATGDAHLWHREKLAERVLRADEAGPLSLGNERYFAAPIPGADPSVGAVCVHGVGAIDTFGRAAIAHAAVVAGMLLVGRRQVQAVHRRFERELLEDLIERRIRRPQEARWRGAGIGWPIRRPYVVAVAGRLENGADSGERALDLDEASLTRVRRELFSLQREVRLFVHRPGLGIVVHLRDDDSAREVACRLADVLTTEVEPFAAGDVGIGVADPKGEIADLADAFREAVLALTLSEVGGGARPSVAHFSDLGPFRLFAHVSDRRHLQATAWSLLRPLDDTALPRRTELLETLAALLAHNMNLTTTSETMFFHYNTIRHRRSTLKELLGSTLDSAEDRLSLCLALSALRLLHADRTLQSRSVEARPPSSGWTSRGPE